MGDSCVCLGSKEIWVLVHLGCFSKYVKYLRNSKCTQLSPIILAKLGYSRIKIHHISDSLLNLQIKIGVHLMSVELSQLLTLVSVSTYVVKEHFSGIESA